MAFVESFAGWAKLRMKRAEELRNVCKKRDEVRSRVLTMRVSRVSGSGKKDPILDDDDDVDMTDITTYVSCRRCFASLMISPERLSNGQRVNLRCHVCEMPAVVTLNMLENVDGTPFNSAAWQSSQESSTYSGSQGDEQRF